MDPITLIVTALAAGAALGVQDTASAAVKDAYASLKALVIKRFAGRAAAERVLAKHEDAPQAWQEPLAKELAEAGADRDTEPGGGGAGDDEPGGCGRIAGRQVHR